MPLHDSLAAYYPLEEPAGETRVDSHDANDLSEMNPVAQVQGVRGNCAHFVGGATVSGGMGRAAAMAMLGWPIHAPGIPDGAIDEVDRAHAVHGYLPTAAVADAGYLSASDNAALSLGASSLTLAVWVYLTSKADFNVIASKHDFATYEGSEYWLYYDGPSDRFYFSVYGAGAEGWVYANTFGPASLETWYFVVGQYELGVGVRISVNGGPADTAAFAAVPNDTATAFAIGSASGIAGSELVGRVDEVGIWKRLLLPEEITYLYNNGRGQTYPLDLDMEGVENVVTVARRQLRQDLMARRLRDTIVGTTTYSPNIAVGSPVIVMDRFRATPDFSGESLYQRAYLRVGSADYRVGSFNTQSGAWISQMLAVSAFGSGAEFEVCERLSATELDDAIDETIAQQRVRMEIGSPSVAGGQFYDLDLAAFPHRILSVFDSYYFAAPTSSLNRQRREFNQHEIVNTGSGTELRVPGGLAGSQQVIVDALLQVTLGPSDLATVNLPDEETVLWGAAARCYDLLIQRSPSQEAALYEKRRREAALQFSMLSQRHLPDMSKALTLAPMDPVE